MAGEDKFDPPNLYLNVCPRRDCRKDARLGLNIACAFRSTATACEPSSATSISERNTSPRDTWELWRVAYKVFLKIVRRDHAVVSEIMAQRFVGWMTFGFFPPVNSWEHGL
jgi:hypothetical protein